MKNVVKKVVIFSMVGMMQIGFGASVIEASPLHIGSSDIQQLNRHDRNRYEHERRERHRHERQRMERERHEREMRRHRHESYHEWRERQRAEERRHQENERRIAHDILDLILN